MKLFAALSYGNGSRPQWDHRRHNSITTRRRLLQDFQEEGLADRELNSLSCSMEVHSKCRCTDATTETTISRKLALAVASWSYSCFSKGWGRPESNTVIFHSNPPKLPGHFEAVSEADGHVLKSCQGRPSVTL